MAAGHLWGLTGAGTGGFMPGDLAVPPGLAAELEAVAARQHRPAAEVLREAVERYLAQDRGAPAEPEGLAAMVERMLASRTKLPEGVTIRDLMTEGRD
jgi:hypothetical protein